MSPSVSPSARRWINAALRMLLCVGSSGIAIGCGGTITENDDLITGDWVVENLVVGTSSEQQQIDLAGTTVVVALSSIRSSLVADVGCHQVFGSFTFLPDGVSSFTVPGSSTQACNAEDLALEDAFVTALESVSSWERQGDSLVFAGPGSSLRLRPL